MKYYLTHRNAGIVSNGADCIACENHGSANLFTVAASTIDGVNGVNENTCPGFTTNLVRESGFLLSTSLVLNSTNIA
jgi:hypothetical protein